MSDPAEKVKPIAAACGEGDELSLPSYLHHTPEVAAQLAAIKQRKVVLSIDHVSREFDGGSGKVLALSDLSFDVRTRELVCVIGASGCGKSTLIRILAGLETPT